MEILYFSNSFASFKCTLNRKFLQKPQPRIRALVTIIATLFHLQYVSPGFLHFQRILGPFDSNENVQNFCAYSLHPSVISCKPIFTNCLLAIFLSLYLSLSSYAGSMMPFTSHCRVGLHDYRLERMRHLESFRI